MPPLHKWRYANGTDLDGLLGRTAGLPHRSTGGSAIRRRRRCGTRNLNLVTNMFAYLRRISSQREAVPIVVRPHVLSVGAAEAALNGRLGTSACLTCLIRVVLCSEQENQRDASNWRASLASGFL
jgi:hypothetical protein